MRSLKIPLEIAKSYKDFDLKLDQSGYDSGELTDSEAKTELRPKNEKYPDFATDYVTSLHSKVKFLSSPLKKPHHIHKSNIRHSSPAQIKSQVKNPLIAVFKKMWEESDNTDLLREYASESGK